MFTRADRLIRALDAEALERCAREMLAILEPEEGERRRSGAFSPAEEAAKAPEWGGTERTAYGKGQEMLRDDLAERVFYSRSAAREEKAESARRESEAFAEEHIRLLKEINLYRPDAPMIIPAQEEIARREMERRGFGGVIRGETHAQSAESLSEMLRRDGRRYDSGFMRY